MIILNFIHNLLKLWFFTIIIICKTVLDFIDFLITESKPSNNTNNKANASFNSLSSPGVRHGKKRRRQQLHNSSSFSSSCSSSAGTCNNSKRLIGERRKLIAAISEENINTPMRIQRRQISLMKIRHLPIELMLCIFEQLPTRKDFYNCLFVCKSWNHIVTPFLYKSLQISHLPPNFPIEKYGSLIKILDLSADYDHVTDLTIQTIALTCPHLRHINLNGCIHISDASLEILSKNSCSSSLISINLCGCRKITDLGLKHLSKFCHSITSLNMADCGKISDKGVIHVAKGCPRLRQIRLSDCPRVTEHSIEVLVQNCVRLCWLDIARIGRITDSLVRVIANSCKENLEWLNLAKPSPLEAVYSSALASPSLLPITYVDGDISFNDDVIDVIKCDTEITDASIDFLTKQCPNLQLLDLSYMNSITNYSIESIANNSFSLVCLTIIGCKFVTCDSLRYLAQLRRKSGHLGCITMGDAAGITEEDIESITNEPEGLLSGWQKSSVDENSLKDILGGVSWEDVGSW